jgi:hypothetical protein
MRECTFLCIGFQCAVGRAVAGLWLQNKVDTIYDPVCRLRRWTHHCGLLWEITTNSLSLQINIFTAIMRKVWQTHNSSLLLLCFNVFPARAMDFTALCLIGVCLNKFPLCLYIRLTKFFAQQFPSCFTLSYHTSDPRSSYHLFVFRIGDYIYVFG